MSWLKEIFLIVTTLPVKTKTIFVFMVAILVAGYFFLDRILDYQAEIIRSKPSSNRYYSNVDKSDYVIERSTSQKVIVNNYQK